MNEISQFLLVLVVLLGIIEYIDEANDESHRRIP